MEIGVYTLARVSPDPFTGQVQNMADHMRDILEEIVLADEVGLDVYGIGENHRPDYAVSAPAVILAAAASRTKRIRLTSSVTVLSADDPVRVFQDFSTLDLLSEGRAEIMAGRGITTESFPLFGYKVEDYDELFIEKLDLLLRVCKDEFVTWSGKHRTPLQENGVYPRPVQQPLPVWVAVGTNAESAERTGRLGLPMAVAFLTGTHERCRSVIELYRQTADEAGHDRAGLEISMNTHGYVADTSQAVVDDFFPYYANAMNALAVERGFPLCDRRRFKAMKSFDGPVIAGSPDEVIEKILFHHDVFGHTRYNMQLSVGAMPHDKVMRGIELLGTKVAPVVKAEVAARAATPAVVEGAGLDDLLLDSLSDLV
jgi:probable LLM family oxidoreductase